MKYRNGHPLSGRMLTRHRWPHQSTDLMFVSLVVNIGCGNRNLWMNRMAALAQITNGTSGRRHLQKKKMVPPFHLCYAQIWILAESWLAYWNELDFILFFLTDAIDKGDSRRLGKKPVFTSSQVIISSFKVLFYLLWLLLRTLSFMIARLL